MPITRGYRVALYAQSDGLVIACLLTLSHPTLGNAYFSSDNTQRLPTDPISYGTVSRALTYTYAPMSIVLPLDEQGSEPTSTIVVENVSRVLVPLVRSAPSDLSAKIEVIDPADPDNVQRTFDNLQVVTGTYDAFEINLGCRVDMLQAEPFPAGRILPGQFRFLF